ncbi:hypothetical protein BHE74_00041673 [Ensete ventricosum]|nr:hypothetical protein BHE74_00041673 [Ensete ventricosum]
MATRSNSDAIMCIWRGRQQQQLRLRGLQVTDDGDDNNGMRQWQRKAEGEATGSSSNAVVCKWAMAAAVWEEDIGDGREEIGPGKSDWVAGVDPTSDGCVRPTAGLRQWQGGDKGDATQ